MLKAKQTQYVFLQLIKSDKQELRCPELKKQRQSLNNEK